eukprot:scaffold103490_cov14-Tisochrysis_lutea.AAC.1
MAVSADVYCMEKLSIKAHAQPIEYNQSSKDDCFLHRLKLRSGQNARQHDKAARPYGKSTKGTPLQLPSYPTLFITRCLTGVTMPDSNHLRLTSGHTREDEAKHNSESSCVFKTSKHPPFFRWACLREAAREQQTERCTDQ